MDSSFINYLFFATSNALKGYVINESRVAVINENYKSLVESINNINNEIVDIKKDILSIKDKINSKELSLEKIFYNGEVYDAYETI